MHFGMYADTHALEDDFWWFVGMRRIGRTLLDPHYPPGTSLDILDVGCGTGANLRRLLSQYGTSVGVDPADAAIRFARNRWPGPLVQASGDALPFADASFDLVTAFGVICQLGVRSDLAVLSECYRVLRPGGRVLLRVPAYEFLKAQHDRVGETRERYYRSQLCRVLEQAGFVVERCTYANMLLFPIAATKRLSERLRPPADPQASDLRPLPAAVNEVLRRVLCAEAPLVRRRDLPYGLSVMALGRRPTPAGTLAVREEDHSPYFPVLAGTRGRALAVPAPAPRACSPPRTHCQGVLP
jgi:ubiquinone/menaquinone biosynthesis C-methylase UbiE